MEGTKAAMSSPRGRIVLRAADAASKGPPAWPNKLKTVGHYLRVYHDQIWWDGCQEEADGQKSCECVQKVIKAVLPSETCDVR